MAPTAATSLTFTASGGTVVGNTLNATNTNFTVGAVTAGDVGSDGGTAELLVGGVSFSSRITTNVASGATSVTLNSILSTTSAVQGAVASGSPVLTVKLTDSAGNTSTAPLTITADYVAPTVSSVTTSDAGTKMIGNTVAITVTMSENVTSATATPTLLIEAGTVDIPATCAAVTASPTLTCTYTVVVGDANARLNYQATTALATTGTLRDAAGNDATLTLPALGTSGLYSANIVVDGVRPRLTQVTRASGAVQATDGSPAPAYTVTFEEPVTGLGVSNFEINRGAGISNIPTVATVAVASGSSPQSVWTVTLSLGSATGTGSATSTLELVLADATGIGDVAGNSMANVNPSGGSGETYILDNTAATVTGVTTTSSGSKNQDDTVTITVTFSEAVTGGTTLTLETGTTDRDAICATATASTTLTCTYTVQAGDTSNHLNYAATTALTGTFTDAAGNAASNPTLPALASSGLYTAAIIIDTTTPGTPTVVLSSDDTAGASVSDGITATAPVMLDITAELASAVAISATKEGSSFALYQSTRTGTGAADTFVPKGSGNTALADGTYVFSVTATDVAGNASAAGTSTVVLDRVAPSAPASLDLDGASDSGTATSDDLTSDTTPTITGTAEASSTVTLYDSSTSVGTATAAGNGTFSITASTLGTGAHTLTAKATDAAGNVSAASSVLTVTIDTTAPQIQTVAIVSASPVVTGTASVAFTVTFTEAVNGVTAATFSIIPGAGLTGTGPAVTVVTGSGTTYTVTVSLTGVVGDGGTSATLGLGMATSSLSATLDAAANAMTSGTPTGTSSTYTVAPAPGASTPADTTIPAPTPVPVVIAKPAPVVAPAPVVVAAPAPISAPPGVSTAGLSNAFAAIPGGLTVEAAKTITTALTAVDTTTAQAFVSTLSALPAAQAAEVLKLMASSTPEEAKATVQFMSTLPAGTQVAKGTTEVSADGKESKTFSLDDDAPDAGTTVDGAEVAGVRSATTGKRTVAILVKAGQVARINRGKSGIWPDLTFPLLSGKLSGVAPGISLPADATSVTFEPTPAGLNSVQQGSLGGGNVVPLGLPFALRVQSATPAARIQFSLPSIKVAPGQTLGYLYSTRSSGGAFAGYLRAPAEFEPPTTRQVWTLSTDEVADLLILPVAFQPAYVQNFAAAARIYSGPDDLALDFGVAGPAFTTFTVVGPQVGTRIFVYSPVSKGYGWIDARGVGPSGPPLN